MGFLSNMFGGSSATDDDAAQDSVGTATCDACGTETAEDELEWGHCEECRSDSSGTAYCCGAIYEEGEETCMSCGEPL